MFQKLIIRVNKIWFSLLLLTKYFYTSIMNKSCMGIYFDKYCFGNTT
jgi:hypothetical protein